MTDRSKVIFGNEIADAAYRAACASKEGFIKRFGDDSQAVYHLAADGLPVIGERLGARNLVMAPEGAAPLSFDERAGTPVVVGTIRMGFGHYRISMAMASAAHALGYAPYWLDLSSFPETTCSKLIRYQNNLYSLGSRLSQRIAPFNALYWEPLNSEGFRKLTYNASDQKVAELMVPLFRDLPKDVPYIGTHAWPSQAAVHAGLTHVVNAIPDNWPMALHLAEGSIHTVQTPSAYLGYKQLRGMDPERSLKPMPDGAIRYTGHYIDHELVSNIASDCAARRARMGQGGPVRWLITVGGAGAQARLFSAIIGKLIPFAVRGEAVLFINVGDHRKVWRSLCSSVEDLASLATAHFDGFAEAASFAEAALTEDVGGIHAFCDSDIFSAVYTTNVLMRCSDMLVTKPSELSFYPVPKLMIHRVGGHEAWGAVRAAEIGDGTYEIEKTGEVLAMIDSMQAEPQLIAGMCDRIEEAGKLGIYDGAYEAVRLAVEGVWGSPAACRGRIR